MGNNGSEASHPDSASRFFRSLFSKQEKAPNEFVQQWQAEYQPFETLQTPNQLQLGDGNIPTLTYEYEAFLTKKAQSGTNATGASISYSPHPATGRVVPQWINSSDRHEHTPFIVGESAQFYPSMIRRATGSGIVKEIFGGNPLSKQDVRRMQTIWEVDTLIAGGMDGYRNAEMLCALTAYRKVSRWNSISPKHEAALTSVFSKKTTPDFYLSTLEKDLARIDELIKNYSSEARAELISLFQEQPRQILLFLLDKITSTLMIPAEKMPESKLQELASIRKILRDVNIVSIASDPLKKALESNINDAMVYLQELWISRAFPHAYAITHKCMHEKIPIPDALRSNAQFSTMIMDRFLHESGIIDANDTNWTIQAGMKSSGSALADILSRDASAPLRAAIKAALKNRELQINENTAETPIDEAFNSLADLENLITDALKNPRDTQELQDIITPVEKEARSLQYIIRARAVPTNGDEAKLAETVLKANQLSSKYSADVEHASTEAVGVISNLDGYWHQKFSYQQLQEMYQDGNVTTPDAQIPISFLKDIVVSTPEGGVGFGMLYILLPTRYDAATNQIHRILPVEFTNMSQENRNSIVWCETQLCLPINILGNLLNRFGWEKRKLSLDPTDKIMSTAISQLDTQNQKIRHQDALINRKRKHFPLTS